MLHSSWEEVHFGGRYDFCASLQCSHQFVQSDQTQQLNILRLDSGRGWSVGMHLSVREVGSQGVYTVLAETAYYFKVLLSTMHALD